MSNRIDCNQKYYNPDSEAVFATRIKDELRGAVVRVDEPLSWLSTDGQSRYSASPIDPAEGDEQQIPYGELRHIGLAALTEMTPAWELRITTVDPDLPAIRRENFFITDRVMTVSAMGSIATALQQGTQGSGTRNALSDTLADPANVTPASVRDHATLDNALFDLASAA